MLPDLVKPEDFKLIKNLKLEYDGFLKFYKYQTLATNSNNKLDIERTSDY